MAPQQIQGCGVYILQLLQCALQEVDLAIVADMGVLQRLPKIVGDGRSFPFAKSCIAFLRTINMPLWATICQTA